MAALSSAITSGRGSMSRIQTTPVRVVARASTRATTSASISGVSGAPAHSTIWTSGGSCATERRKCGRPFCRVIRPTKTTEGRSGSTPSSRTRAGAWIGAQSAVSMPLCTTCTRSGSIAGYDASTSSRMAAETAITADAASYDVRSAHDDTAYPPPSCSAFHGRNGSRECAVTTWGTPCSRLAR